MDLINRELHIKRAALLCAVCEANDDLEEMKEALEEVENLLIEVSEGKTSVAEAQKALDKAEKIRIRLSDSRKELEEAQEAVKAVESLGRIRALAPSFPSLSERYLPQPEPESATDILECMGYKYIKAGINITGNNNPFRFTPERAAEIYNVFEDARVKRLMRAIK